MKKYKCRSKVIEAIQYSGDNLDEVSRFIGISKEALPRREGKPELIIPDFSFYIPTKNDIKLVIPGDYITKDSNRELNSYSSKDFVHSFEPEDANHVSMLKEQLSNLRYTYSEIHDVIEWAELTESYDKASAVYREIEKLESMVNSL